MSPGEDEQALGDLGGRRTGRATARDGLTVIVPLYQGAAFIGETLDSLQRQTRPVDEVLVIDDGSTDEGPSLVAAHPIGATLISQPNHGVAVARNRAAALAETDWIAFLDQDDLWLPTRHARLRRYLEAHRSCRAVITTERSFYLARDADALRRSGELLHRTADFPAVGDALELLDGQTDDGSTPPALRTVSTRDLLAGTVTVTTSYVFDRTTFLAAGGCAPFARSLDDYWALLDISRITDLVAIDEPSVRYRIHPDSTTMTTAWALPLLTSAIAARHGGNLVRTGDARSPSAVPPVLDDVGFWSHWLLRLGEDGSLGDLVDALAVVRLLGRGRREQVQLAARQVRHVARAAARRQLRRGSADGRSDGGRAAP